MSDVQVSDVVTLANVVDNTLVQKTKDDVLGQIKQIDAALAELDTKRNELVVLRFKLEGAIGFADHMLRVMGDTPDTPVVSTNQNPPSVPIPDSSNNDHTDDGA